MSFLQQIGNAIVNFLTWTDFYMVKSPAYGWFHLMFLGIMVVASVLLGYFGRKHSSKTVNKIIFGFGVFLAIIEIYKQLLYTFVNNGGVYDWYNFPFQFCSVPIFVCLIAPWIKNEKVQSWFYDFLALYALLAGLSVMLYPGDVFNTNQGPIQIHTMLWHSSMVIIGVYVLCSKHVGVSFKEVLKGYVVYLGFVFLALVGFDIVLYKIVNTKINMFFISPYYTNHMIIFNSIQANYGWLPMFICYLFAFFLGAVIIWSVAKLVRVIGFAVKKRLKLASAEIVEKNT